MKGFDENMTIKPKNLEGYDNQKSDGGVLQNLDEGVNLMLAPIASTLFE